MALQIYQDRQAVFVDPVAAVQARRAHLTQKLAELLTLGEDLECEVGGDLARQWPESSCTVTERPQKVIPLQLK
ncbi:hypothetical protein AWC24_00955 [Mycolicibacter senuensis]|nr:hypothetical protein AWC24_00955 [Mycolicibacter senuensis]